MGGRFHTFYYADDLALVCQDLLAVKRAIKLVEEWGKKNQMLLNKNKCGIFKLRNSGRKFKINKQGKMEVQPPSEFVLDIPIVRHYKYLGVVFDDSL